MDIAIEFNPAAFKHGVSEADIKFVILNALYDNVLDDTDNKHLVLGFDRNGNLLEILYNIIKDDSINVFHTMSCRNRVVQKLQFLNNFRLKTEGFRNFWKKFLNPV